MFLSRDKNQGEKAADNLADSFSQIVQVVSFIKLKVQCNKY